MSTLHPSSAAELGELLQGRPGQLRVRGGGSRQDRLPAAPSARVLDLSAFAGIERLDAPDQTCTVGAGLPRAELDEALRQHRLELPSLGGGTIGGLFATDSIGPATVGSASPRTLLLGITAMLADGTRFQAGARVVKSVAGFDVHKLFVGSRGTLFAALHLHLRLKPMPRASMWFAMKGLEQTDALDRFTKLRSLAVPPAELQLQRNSNGWAIAGRIAGRDSFVRDTMRAHNLHEGPPITTHHLESTSRNGEVLAGNVLPSRVTELLAMTSAGAPFLLHGGGRFELQLDSIAATDELLPRLPALRIDACIALGENARRGLGTPIDPGQQHITAGLKQALDPHGTFV
jgi:hypothetical protein